VTTYREAIEKITGHPVAIVQTGTLFEIKPFPGANTTNRIVARFYMQVFPACCGACISYGAAVYAPYLNKGLGKLLNKMRIQLAHDCRRKLIICTDVEKNTHQQKILKANGWQKATSWLNPRSHNDVGLHYRVTGDTGMQIGMVDHTTMNPLHIP